MTSSSTTSLRRWLWSTTMIASVALTTACGGDAEPTSESSSDPTESAVEPTEESLRTFADAYVETLNDKDQQAADEMACDGTSVIYTTYTTTDTKWEVTDVLFGVEHSSVVFNYRDLPTSEDFSAGFTAVFVDGEWCAEQ